ncbi:MAG: transcriptional repressor NrdR [Candidatus Marinimicrobia bacterium]|nr:transcriptional repressor NrdR [Candidatus Neomarinimicrobiota bacterium]
MNCPFCGSSESKVVDSRTVNRESSVRRRRECLSCSQRFTTYEYIVSQPLLVIKKSGAREEFDRARIEASMKIACNKRPVPAQDLMDAVARVQSQIEELGKAEVPSAAIGEMVMAQLKELDKVAYIRFASVYREFADIGAFRAEIDQLEGKSGE